MGRPSQALSWNFACPDWADRLRAGRSLLPALRLDEAESERAVAIFNTLRLPDVPGQPTMGEAAGEWGRDIVRAVFGSMVDGQRMVREVFGMVPKKNAKTTNAAALAVTALLMNERPRAEMVLVGPTQEIADLGFQAAAGMIDADPYLKDRFQVQEHRKTIIDQVTSAKLKVKTFDMKVATGVKPVAVFIDELHLMGQMKDAQRVIAQLRGGMITNPEAFLVMITTQSDAPPAGAFRAELQYARGVRDGRIENGRVLPLIYEFPEEMQTGRDKAWRDVRNWPMVLPNLGRPFTVDRLLEEYQAACEKGVEEEIRWASQHLNVQIGLALHSDRWRGADYWEGAAFEPIRDLDAMLARCEVAVIGIDGGGLDDLTGMCVAGRDRKSKVWLYWFHAWAHRKVLEIRKEIAPRLIDFETEGSLTFWGDPNEAANVATRLLDDGEEEEFVERPARAMTDPDILEIVTFCQTVRSAQLLPENGGIGVDQASLGGLLDALEEKGFTISDGKTGDVQAVSQSVVNMFSAISTLERKLEAGWAAHGGLALMNWCVGNAKAELRGNSVAITKQQAGKAKIDPLVAGFVATKLLDLNPEAKPAPVYERRGMLVI